MYHYMVCIDNNNYKCITCDDFEILFSKGVIRFYTIEETEKEVIQHNIAYFILNNIKGFWKDDKVEKMGE